VGLRTRRISDNDGEDRGEREATKKVGKGGTRVA
jgi:hypothetical protein